MDLLTRASCALVICGAAACVPDLADRGSLVEGPRVLAVRALPAEAKAGESVRWEALTVDGERDAPPSLASQLDWALCTDPVPLDRVEPVSPRCLAPAADWLLPIGAGPSVSAAIPSDACRRFGPTPPDPPPGQSAARPVDPDRTGGYYQPLRALVPSSGDGGEPAYVTFRTRVSCGVAGASLEVTAELNRRARPNLNPAIARLARVDGGRDEELLPDGAPLSVAAGAEVRLRVETVGCEVDAACEGAERYAALDPISRGVAERREALRSSWFATAGTFADERTGIPADDPSAATTIENGWRAPDGASEVRLWVVLRDDRGGVGWRSYRVTVTP